jgi:hypothetical protein
MQPPTAAFPRLADYAARRACLLVLLCVACLPVGCASGPPKIKTTFLRSVDLVDMTDRMAQSFAGNDVITARDAHDEPWIVSFYRIVNHTNQIIPEREKWLYIARLRAQLAQSRIADQRRIIWIIPPERWAMVAEELDVSEEPYGLRMNPTHLLTAEFNTLTTTSGRGRSDTYVCSYQLIDLRTGVITWEDAWEVKRQAVGVTYD